MLNIFKRKVKLPQTAAEFDALVDKIVSKYNLPNKEHAAAVIGLTISHTEKAQAYLFMDTLGHAVMRNIAYQVASARVSEMNHKAQIDQLAMILQNDPLNQQAIDHLTKASNEGSSYAKEALKKHQPAEDSANNVLHIGGSIVGDTKTGA